MIFFYSHAAALVLFGSRLVGKEPSLNVVSMNLKNGVKTNHVNFRTIKSNTKLTGLILFRRSFASKFHTFKNNIFKGFR